MKRTKLPKAFKAKWIKALRSGKYEQGKSTLHHSRFDTYCCLGVAGAVCGVSVWDLSGEGTFEGRIGTIAQNKGLPKMLIGSNTKGEEDFNPLVSKLVDFNDDKKRSFKWIASYIERYL